MPGGEPGTACLPRMGPAFQLKNGLMGLRPIHFSGSYGLRETWIPEYIHWFFFFPCLHILCPHSDHQDTRIWFSVREDCC